MAKKFNKKIADMVRHAKLGTCSECSVKLRERKNRRKKSAFDMDDYLQLSAAIVHKGIFTSGL